MLERKRLEATNGTPGKRSRPDLRARRERRRLRPIRSQVSSTNWKTCKSREAARSYRGSAALVA